MDKVVIPKTKEWQVKTMDMVVVDDDCIEVMYEEVTTRFWVSFIFAFSTDS